MWMALISQHWFRWCLCDNSHEANAWTTVNPNLYPHMASLRQNELMIIYIKDKNHGVKLNDQSALILLLHLVYGEAYH